MSKTDHLAFHPIEDPKVLMPIVEERLPRSCHVYNQIKMHEKFKEDLSFYTVGKEINSDTWIVSEYTRADYRSMVSILAPAAIVEGREEIPLSIKELFSMASLVNWDEFTVFVALEKPVSQMIVDISANVKGNITELHPCILYNMSTDEALQLEISPDPGMEIRRLDADKESDFIVKTWNYSLEGTDVATRKCIKGAASAGVFIDGKCASGVITHGNGFLSCLYTNKEYRNRGLAKLTMKQAFKDTAKNGCIPCLTVEVRNERSIGFHQSIGAKVVSVVNWVDAKKLNVD